MKKKPMFVLIIGCGMFLALASAGAAKDPVVQSKWTTAPPALDGAVADWSGETFVLNKSLKIEYGVRNDADNLYVLLMFKDPQFLSSIDRTGLTVYVDAQGKKKKDFGIKFQRKNLTADQLIDTLEKSGETLTEERKAEIKQRSMYQLYHAAIVDKKGEEVKTESIPQGGHSASFRSGRDGQVVTYELRIPLAARTVTPHGIGTEPGKGIKIGFEWGGMTPEEREARLKGMGAMTASSGRAGDITEETSVEAPGGAGFESVMRGPKKFDFWADILLAVSQ